MGRGQFTKDEIKSLRKNPYVSDVSQTRIAYSSEFKTLFMNQYTKGKKPVQIFRDAGFDPKVLGSKRIERASARWRESYRSGTLGQRDAVLSKGKANAGRTDEDDSIDLLQASREELIERCRQQESIIRQLQAQRRAVQRILNRGICDVSEAPVSAEISRTTEEETEHKQEGLAERKPE